MLFIERKDGRLHFHDDERDGFFSATIHQPEGSDAFEVTVRARGKRRKSGSVFTSTYLAPTLHAAGQIVTSEYHLADAAVDSDDSTLAVDFWLDQLDGGLRWHLQFDDDSDDEDDPAGDDEDDDSDDEGDGPENEGLIRMIGRITRR